MAKIKAKKDQMSSALAFTKLNSAYTSTTRSDIGSTSTPMTGSVAKSAGAVDAALRKRESSPTITEQIARQSEALYAGVKGGAPNPAVSDHIRKVEPYMGRKDTPASGDGLMHIQPVGKPIISPTPVTTKPKPAPASTRARPKIKGRKTGRSH